MKKPSRAGILPETIRILEALERKVLWLSCWIVHHANLVRPTTDRLKVGGHQASSASVVTLMTALYFHILRREDRVAVKPHASPVYHAIQYLLGRQSRMNLERFRGLGGAQAYPSRTKDVDGVDFSTGSVGLGVATTVFASFIQDYLLAKDLLQPGQLPGRMVAIVGDAELDEGNVFEALFEGWKHDLRNVWWVIDYNRQSLDLVVEDQLIERVHQMFRLVDWNVVVMKYGRRLQSAFEKPGGDALRRWIDNCPNSLFSALVYQGGAAWRDRLRRDLGTTSGIPALLDDYDDNGLHTLLTNLAGHDMQVVLEAFHAVKDDRPTAFVAYTIKGYGLPLAGHKDNHAGLMSAEQCAQLQRTMRIKDGEQWAPFAGLDIPAEKLEAFISMVPFARGESRTYRTAQVPIPRDEKPAISNTLSTQGALGRFLNQLGRTDHPLVERIVTASPDVASSTNLGPWITKRGIFERETQRNFFAEQSVVSNLAWASGPQGQHFELGIAETNLFLLLGVAGLAAELFGERLFPIGTLYDPFVRRGLDALNYACYQDARFIVAGTPSGVTLATEGGAHQSVFTPLIGNGQPGLTYFEPAYADELHEILMWSLEHLQAVNGGSIYLRLSTRKIDQPRRTMDKQLREDILAGGYWLFPPDREANRVLISMGAILPEAIEACQEAAIHGPSPGLLVVTSPDRLAVDWQRSGAEAGDQSRQSSYIQKLLAPLNSCVELVTVLDGHPLGLAWIGAATGNRVRPLGVTKFGASGSLQDVYAWHGIGTDAIVAALLEDRTDRWSRRRAPLVTGYR